MMNKRYGKYCLASFVSILTFAVYLPALRNEFVNWDDISFIVDNSHIRSIDLDFLRWAFTDLTTTGNWHPLTWISYAVDYAVWGLNPKGYHLTGILLHAANTFVVVLLSTRLVGSALLPVRLSANASDAETAEKTSFPEGPAVLMAGSVSGILFGLHPLHVEPAVWAADRRDLLCSLFSMLSIAWYSNHAAAHRGGGFPGAARSIMPGRNYILALVCMLFAGASKSMAVSLPLIFLLLDWYPFNRVRSLKELYWLVLEKAPFLVLSFALSVAAYTAQNAYKAIVPVSVLSFDVRILVAFRSIVMYLWKMAVPMDLLPFYHYPREVSFWTAEYLAMTSLVGGITAASIVVAKKHKIYLAAWIWFIVTLAPVIGIVQIGSHSMADRYVYLPSLGFCMLAGTGAAWAWTKTASAGKWGHRIKLLGSIGMISLVCVLSYATVQQIAIWRNAIGLWSYVIERDPGRVPIAYNNRGLAYKEKDMLDHALSDFTQAITLDPSDARFYNNRGTIMGGEGQANRAIEDFTQAISLAPDFAAAYSNRGLKYEEARQFDRALEDLNEAIRLDPSFRDAYLNRGLTFEGMHQLDRAIQDYNKVLALDPSDYLALSYRGIVFGKRGEVEKAFADYDRTLLLKPDYADCYLYRGDLYMRTGNPSFALRDYQRACELGSEAGCKALIDRRKR